MMASARLVTAIGYVLRDCPPVGGGARHPVPPRPAKLVEVRERLA